MQQTISSSSVATYKLKETNLGKTKSFLRETGVQLFFPLFLEVRFHFIFVSETISARLEPESESERARERERERERESDSGSNKINQGVSFEA